MKKIEINKKKKQDALLNTAYQLFTKKGFHKTSISDIAKEAGVAKGTFYLYFKDKLDLRYKLIAKKSAQIFKEAYAQLLCRHIEEFEEQMIFLINEVIQSLEKDPMVLKMITKHLGWGMFKNSLVEPIDDTQRNIHDVYMDLMKQSEYEYREPEMMIYLIIEMTAGCCYNSILMEQPVPMGELLQYLYDAVRLIIQNHQIKK